MPFSGITEASKSSIKSIFTTVGTHSPFFIQPDDSVTGADDWYYVRFEESPSFANSGCSGGGLIWDVTLNLIEEPNP